MGKKFLSSNISSTCLHNMVNFGLLAAEIGSLVWGTPANFNGFVSWQRYCTALQYKASVKLCGVEQRSPPIFGRAAIRWALAHISSSISFFFYPSPNLSGRRLDVYHTSTHGVVLVRI